MKLSDIRLNSTFIRLLDFAVVAISLVIVNLTAFTGLYQFPEVKMFTGPSWLFVPSLFLVAILIIVLIWQGRLWHLYQEVWQKNKVVAIFVFLALLSLTWTVYPEATLYKWLFLAFSTFAGSYIAVRFRGQAIVDILSIAAIISIIISFLLILLFPDFGKLLNPVFNGAWRGVFWHRNHMGSMMAYFSILLLYQSMNRFSRKRPLVSALYALFYLGSAVLVFGSRSATGILLFVGLNILWWLGVAWVRFNRHLSRQHYFVFAGIALVVVIAILLNLNNIFGLLGRESTLTGRLPLWQELIFNVARQRPFLGYGYGGYWMVEQNRLSLQAQFGWTYPVFFADNGFIDILLGLGVLGLGIFLYLIGLVLVRTIQLFMAIRSVSILLLIITLVYVLSSNLTYSFMLEVDQFVWMLFVITAFLVTPGVFVSEYALTENRS